MNYLESKHEDTSTLLESTPLPEEFLRDPSYWMQAEDMERFLQTASRLFSSSVTSTAEENLMEEVGHATPELRGWGIFDSVLRMMSMQDVLAQPKRFLSYFISPEPPVDNIVKSETALKFDLPIPADQFPFTCSYLRASFETLPVFSGMPMASCKWEGITLTFEWENRQKNIFTEQDPGHQVSPELMRSIVAQLEKHQMELQQKNAELEARNEQLRKAYQKLESDFRQKMSFDDPGVNTVEGAVQSNKSEVNSGLEIEVDSSSLHALKDQVSRLGDYMVRAQQLMAITASSAQGNAVKEAMRRMDWKWVKEQFPITMASCFEILNQIEKKNFYSNRTQKSLQEKNNV